MNVAHDAHEVAVVVEHLEADEVGDVVGVGRQRLELLTPHRQLGPALDRTVEQAASSWFPIAPTIHPIMWATGPMFHVAQELGVPLGRDVGYQVRFENVSFRYDTQPVLTEINLDLRAGELVALVAAAGLYAWTLTTSRITAPELDVDVIPALFFLFLLFFGSGIMLALGVARGVLVGLLMLSGWIAVKQLLGIWEQIRLLDHLMELILVALTFVFAGRYHDRLQDILDLYKENQKQLKQLDLEDNRIGLLKPSIGLLRLSEEEERSVRYRRPFALVLVMVQPIPGDTWESHESWELMRAIAAGIKDTTRETDIPFLAAKNKIAVILPETETNGANKVVNNIFNRMTTTQFLTPYGLSRPIHTRVQLRFGFAAFLGTSHTKINMMEAAETSLQRSLEINSSELFQNIFIEWATVGELAIPTPLLEKMAS